jgi:GDPmannose 4,6-dehydratase
MFFMKIAIITGITGQDGSFLAELLLEKGYFVVGLKRRTSTINTERVNRMYENKNFKLEYWDSDDSYSLIRYILQYNPNEIYHLSSQSHVRVSFDVPEFTFNSAANSTLKILEIIRTLKKDIKLYVACSSEIFGSSPAPQNEQTRFIPQSPYAIGKVAAYHLSQNYRNAYGIFSCNGILFNHESERRGETFVSRKITLGVSSILKGQSNCLILGNLDARRDWGYAKDYVEAMYLMMQRDKADDFVIATEETHSVREFCEKAFEYVGYDIEWKGSGLNEIGIEHKSGKTLVTIDKKYFRPTEVNILQGDALKAKTFLGWKPKTSFRELVKIMMENDLND